MVIILCEVAKLSRMVVTLSNGVDFSIFVNVLISEFSCDVVDNLVSCDVYEVSCVVYTVSFDVYEVPCGVVLIVSAISGVKDVFAISGELIL